MLIDTHCHLADSAYDADRAAVIDRAEAAGVERIVVVGESRESAQRALALAADDRRLAATAGIHPHIASQWTADTAAWMRDTLLDPRIVAAGEMGLDYHYDHSPRATQKAVFAQQLALAAAAGKPAVIHAREADDDVSAILREHPATIAILHSFSSGPELLASALEAGHYVSFSGMVTFNRWDDDAAIRAVPLDRLLVETDGPYLAPVPHRGKRNEPAWVVRVAERIAEVRGLEPAELARVTWANTRRLFGDRLGAA